MPESGPIILTVVSGKGGVGKTMLSVALAQELSLGAPTLVIDLDFFNRGLTGLMRGGDIVGQIERPSFLPETSEHGADAEQSAEFDKKNSSSQEEDDERAFQLESWSLVKMSGNLIHLKYPDLTAKDRRYLESMPIEELIQELETFVHTLTRKCGCEFVVLDCHGGPDKTSFAACHVAQHTLLISEPDRITLYGTLNFLRQLDLSGQLAECDVRLIFNKVVPSFSMPFLRRFYNRNLRSEFGGHTLLAVFPMEEYLTKAFERHTLLTLVYPNSLLARKTRSYIYHLLAKDHGDKLADSITKIPRFVRAFRSATLGKKFFLANYEFAIAAIFAVGMTIAAAALLIEYGGDILPRIMKSRAESYIELFGDSLLFVTLASLWFVSTLVQDWLVKVDRAMTYRSRTRGVAISLSLSILQVLLLAPFIVIFFASYVNLLEFNFDDINPYSWVNPIAFAALVNPTAFAALVISGTVVVFHMFDQLFRLIRNRRYEKHRIEDFSRLLLFLGIIFTLLVTIRSDMLL